MTFNGIVLFRWWLFAVGVFDYFPLSVRLIPNLVIISIVFKSGDNFQHAVKLIWVKQLEDLFGGYFVIMSLVTSFITKIFKKDAQRVEDSLMRIIGRKRKSFQYPRLSFFDQLLQPLRMLNFWKYL